MAASGQDRPMRSPGTTPLVATLTRVAEVDTNVARWDGLASKVDALTSLVTSLVENGVAKQTVVGAPMLVGSVGGSNAILQVLTHSPRSCWPRKSMTADLTRTRACTLQ